MENLKSKVAGFVNTKVGKVVTGIAGVAPVLGASAGFCTDGTTPSKSVITLSSDMFTPITDTVQGNLPVLIGAGVSLMAINIAVSLIPRIVYKFF